MQDWYYYPHFTNKHKVTWSQDLNRGLNEYKVHPFSLQKFVCQLYMLSIVLGTRDINSNLKELTVLQQSQAHKQTSI